MFSIHEGNVIYRRGARTELEYWKKVYEKNISDSQSYTEAYKKSSDITNHKIGTTLQNLARIERDKEKQLLLEAGFTIEDDNDLKEFVSKFNQVLMGKKQFEAALKRLSEALKQENQSRGNRAPTIASWFGSYLQTALNRKLTAFSNDRIILEGNPDETEKAYNKAIEEAIDDALKAMLVDTDSKREEKELYGSKLDWVEVYDAFQKLGAGFLDSFHSMVRTQLDFDKLKGEILKERDNKTDKTIRKIIGSSKGLNLEDSRKSRMFGGYVQEYINAAIVTACNEAGVKSSAGGRVLSSNILKTDSVTIFHFRDEINTARSVQNIVDKLDDALLPSESLKDANRRMEAFYNENLRDLDNSFIVYQSTKSSALTESFRGFHAGGKRKLIDLLEMENPVMNKDNVRKCIYSLYNTANGAIFSRRKHGLTELTKTMIIESMATLLFDDWSTIGTEQKTGAKAIHVLSLEGIQLPLSILLYAAGTAIIETSKDLSRYFNVSIKTISEIKYPDPYYFDTEGMTEKQVDKKYKEDLIKMWNEQAQEAEANTVFSARFLSNFKTEISKYLQFE